MQILILYYSKGGNTRKLAQEIAKGVEAVPDMISVLKTCDAVTKEDFLNSEGIIAGSPVYFGSMTAELKKVFDDFVSVRKKMENKIGAAFATSGDPSGGKETTMIGIIQCFLIYGMIIAGDPMDATGHYGVSCVGAPDEKTSENGFKMGKRVADICVKMSS